MRVGREGRDRMGQGMRTPAELGKGHGDDVQKVDGGWRLMRLVRRVGRGSSARVRTRRGRG